MYDIFLGGPWERYTHIPYKSLIKSAFPTANIYDPETVQKDWFDRNLSALRKSTVLLAFAPAFPLPGVGPEIGVYYEHRLLMGRQPNIVVVWPEELTPAWGQEVLAHMGKIVGTVEEAIVAVAGILRGTGHDAPRPLIADGVQGYDLEIPD